MYNFMPEGYNSATSTNKEYLSSLQGLEYAMSNGIILEARATMCDNDFNLRIDIPGYNAIIPYEEVALTPDDTPCKEIAAITRVGKSVCFVIDRINGSSLLLSRRKAQKKCVEQYLSHLNIGDVIDAKVTHFENFGAFCDIGCGIASLLSIDCISVSRISHPRDRFRIGQHIKVAVRSAEQNGNLIKIALTHKELLGTWRENIARFQVGQTVAGIVRSVESYGIFIELAPNLSGLSELKDGVECGQTAAVYIKSIIEEKMKVKLVVVDFHSNDGFTSVNYDYFITAGNINGWDYYA
ncbi:MAG: S1 RNA-binding domain-containing protein [Clostridia bacterium]|nr:S1 RNA-binding domain-containing protein [Clostridia bacterium]